MWGGTITQDTTWSNTSHDYHITSASTKHIFLTDLDSMEDFMTTEGMGMKFTSEPASLDIIFPASWYVRGD